jgi:hypothetical protein
MKCAEHPAVDATGYCHQCGKPLCPDCTRDVRGALYCENCLASLVSAPQPPGAGTPAAHAESGAPNPSVALALGFIPGLGAVYNGEYLKGLIHVLAFGGIIAAQTTDIPVGLHVILGIGLGCFYFYMPIEAYRTAKARRGEDAQPVAGAIAERNRPVGAIVLIVLGVLFLLANFHILEREWFSKVWPLGLIAIGVWIMADRLRRTS